MEPVKVPQHLEIEDVLVWGLSATDLLWLAGGLLASWWIYLNLLAPLPLQLAAAALPSITGAALGPCRFAERPLRASIAELLAFVFRPRHRSFRGDL